MGWNRHGLIVMAAAALLASCSAVPGGDRLADIERSLWAGQSGGAAIEHVSPAPATGAQWQHHVFPGKTPTRFTGARKDGRNAMAVTAIASASMLRNKIRIEPAALDKVNFSWNVPELITQADMGSRDADDSPVRIVLMFEGDRSRLSARNGMLFELAHTLTGEEMPYATLMYVWCNKRHPGTVIDSPRTDRIRKVVVESGTDKLNRWLDYERDIRADFQHAFGEPPGALVGIGIMTDTDNTRATTSAWYGPLRLTSATVTGQQPAAAFTVPRVAPR